MTDPFSVAGSAVGVVSLGITACKSLIWYIDNAKDAEDRASQISDRLDSLASHLELLQTIVEKFGPSQCVSATTSAITACATAIEEIRKRLGKLGKPKGTSGIREQINDMKRRLSYPFKQEDILYWRDILKDIHQDLHTALLTLSLYVVYSVFMDMQD